MIKHKTIINCENEVERITYCINNTLARDYTLMNAETLNMKRKFVWIFVHLRS